MSSRLDELEPWLAPWAAELIRRAAPYGAVVTSTYRSAEQQQQLYEAFLRGANRYPVAPPGHSYHQFRRAFDVAGPDWLLEAMGELWQSWGGRWGGCDGGDDPIHFEV